MDVLVLGNGFDLSHILPTTYLSFLRTTEYFVFDNNDLRDVTIGKVFRSIQNQCKTIKNSYEAYRDVYDNHVLEKKKISDLLDKCRRNHWWHCFHVNYNKNDVHWIDFEKEISNVIVQVSGFVHNHQYPTHSFRMRNTESNSSIAYFFPAFAKLVADSYDFDFLYDFYIYDREFRYDPDCAGGDPKDKNCRVDKKKIAEKLFQSLEEFSQILDLYFQLFVDDTIEELKQAKLIPVNEEYKKFKNVITYNYTRSFEKIYGSSQVAHIHGSIGNRIILGINSNKDDEIDGDLSFVEFKKYYQRVVFGTDMDYLAILLGMRKAAAQKETVSLSIVGHSLDDTDKDSLTELFEVSNEINIYYHDGRKIPEFVQNLIRHFGKTKFDELRYDRKLLFISQDSLTGPEKKQRYTVTM